MPKQQNLSEKASNSKENIMKRISVKKILKKRPKEKTLKKQGVKKKFVKQREKTTTEEGGKTQKGVVTL